jgi:hypothetical protein
VVIGAGPRQCGALPLPESPAKFTHYIRQARPANEKPAVKVYLMCGRRNLASMKYRLQKRRTTQAGERESKELFLLEKKNI